jgi:hypothetical protein
MGSLFAVLYILFGVVAGAGNRQVAVAGGEASVVTPFSTMPGYGGWRRW